MLLLLYLSFFTGEFTVKPKHIHRTILGRGTTNRYEHRQRQRVDYSSEEECFRLTVLNTYLKAVINPAGIK